MKLAIVGSRKVLISYDEFKSIIRKSLDLSFIDTIVSGGAKGIDSFAEQFATENHLKLIVYKPDYSRYGKSAPLVRNTLIIEDSDLVLALPSKDSKGTWDSIKKAQKLNKRLKIVQI